MQILRISKNTTTKLIYQMFVRRMIHKISIFKFELWKSRRPSLGIFLSSILPHFSSFLECCEEKKNISLWVSGDFCYCSTRLNCRWHERRLSFKFTMKSHESPHFKRHFNDSFVYGEIIKLWFFHKKNFSQWRYSSSLIRETLER